MNTELYSLIEALTDSLEWCYEQIEEIDSNDARIIRDIIAQANKQIEQGYLD